MGNRHSQRASILGKAPANVLNARQAQLGSTGIEPGEYIIRNVADQHVTHSATISHDIAVSSPKRKAAADGDCARLAPNRCLERTYSYIIKNMALSIKDPEADRLARELAARTGETLTEAIVVALRERLARETGRTRAIPLSEELSAIRRRCAALPVLDTRTADEILGYNEPGLPA